MCLPGSALDRIRLADFRDNNYLPQFVGGIMNQVRKPEGELAFLSHGFILEFIVGFRIAFLDLRVKSCFRFCSTI